MAEQKIDLKSMTLPEIESFLTTLGNPNFRAKADLRLDALGC